MRLINYQNLKNFEKTRFWDNISLSLSSPKEVFIHSLMNLKD